MRKPLVFLSAIALSCSLQAQDAFTAIAGQKTNIPIKVKAEMSCSIEITLGARKEQRVAEAPGYEVPFEFQSQDPGVTEIRWEGKFRSRGLRSTPACPGSGLVRVTTVPNTEQRKAEWARVFAPLRPEQRTCLQVGLTHRGVKFESTDPQASLDGPTAPAAREVFAKCDSFFMVPRVWGVNDPTDYPCALAGGLKSRCSANYAERLPDGRLAPISLEAAIVSHLDGKSWTTDQRESDAARDARERLAREDQMRRDAEQARREAELAAKRQAEERERQARMESEERERRARIEAEERDRRLKESPEYRRQQAELERRRVAELLATEEKTRREKDQIEQAARLQRQEAERRRAAEQAAAEERARVEKEQAEQAARQRRQDEERRQAERVERERAERARMASTFPYYALITCGFRGQHTNVLACFAGRVGTEIELRNGSRYGLYKVHEISGLGQESREGLRIDLQKKFELRAQNSDETLILGVKIVDRSTNETLFEKQVGRFGVISVKE
jgi:murein DD-endopeptidase MepM/ murein hydrolase activator NlpD